jgi:hypothetical protein
VKYILFYTRVLKINMPQQELWSFWNNSGMPMSIYTSKNEWTINLGWKIAHDHITMVDICTPHGVQMWKSWSLWNITVTFKYHQQIDLLGHTCQMFSCTAVKPYTLAYTLPSNTTNLHALISSICYKLQSLRTIISQ